MGSPTISLCPVMIGTTLYNVLLFQYFINFGSCEQPPGARTACINAEFIETTVLFIAWTPTCYPSGLESVLCFRNIHEIRR